MRLSKIKLAGFKSFVDPTSIAFPSDLVSILGPNGCGKSNIIDAVRWVMGESSAKNLRGDSMTDVIFNGSSARKPVGNASVELIFDNSKGKITGEYAKYNEISVKRTVNRDSQSHYFLNSARCRRKDITDLFLGTGLGPRSYSIIEQGMISRLIEAKPEELRIFIEEAAGISRYKERRRETENRIRHTRENLLRLEDVRAELEKQLTHLQKQARTAERYAELKREERLCRAQLQALRWFDLKEKSTVHDQLIREYSQQLEKLTADLRQTEAELERTRETHIQANEDFNVIQGEFYRVGAEIARIEQTIQLAKERRAELLDDLALARKAFDETQGHVKEDEEKISLLEEQLHEIEPEFEQLKEIESSSIDLMHEKEESMHDWQSRWDDFIEQERLPSQTAQIERTRINQLEQSIRLHQQRLDKLQTELSHHDTTNMLERLEAMRLEAELAASYSETVEQELEQQNNLIHDSREQVQRLENELNGLRGDKQRAAGRRASLEALQQQALGQNDKGRLEWLEKNGLQHNQRLAHKVHVQSGWEKAVECVLGDRLEAIVVDDLAHSAQSIKADGIAGLSLVTRNGVVTNTAAGLDNFSDKPGLPLLSRYLEASELAGPMLAGVYAAETLAEALEMQSSLTACQIIITQDGIMVGANWIHTASEEEHHSGILAREHELTALHEEIDYLSEQEDELVERLEEARADIHEHEHQRETLQSEIKVKARAQADIDSKISALSVRIEQVENRINNIQNEIEEINAQISSETSTIEKSTSELHMALEQMELLAEEKDRLGEERESIRRELDETRIKAREDRERSHALEIRLRGIRSERDATQQALNRLVAQQNQNQGRCQRIEQQLLNEQDPDTMYGQELKNLLNRRSEVEVNLAEARNNVENQEHRLRELDKQRLSVEQDLRDNGSILEKEKLSLQEINIHLGGLAEQLDAAGYNPNELREGLPEDAQESEWEISLARLAEKITRLGPINLAAIDEFKEHSERKTYLDAQNQDLTDALETLEAAIAKIDRETRTRFKETFDRINSGVQRLFPKLFGGGHAYIEMTGEDLLDTGVAIMARPPGKRNSTIHLLSGGEKAMTAVALVFSIFELNPAPFCMLDEVDAPLDEANVGRFCSMVKEMSEHVQFIYITHNKTTMEMSEHLTGVTMKEPGVSRIVDVDIHEAVEMVEG